MNESEKLVEPSPKIGDALLAGVNTPALTFQVFLAQYVLIFSCVSVSSKR